MGISRISTWPHLAHQHDQWEIRRESSAGPGGAMNGPREESSRCRPLHQLLWIAELHPGGRSDAVISSWIGHARHRLQTLARVRWHCCFVSSRPVANKPIYLGHLDGSRGGVAISLWTIEGRGKAPRAAVTVNHVRQIAPLASMLAEPACFASRSTGY